MRAIIFVFSFIFLSFVSGQDFGVENVEEVEKRINLCSVCTCSEISDLDSVHYVLNIYCSETDKVEKLTDLEKIEWPDNHNGLKIFATFEGFPLPTLGKLPPNAQIESLRFSNNAIKTYWPDPFSDLPTLKKLSFYQNDLQAVTKDLFTNIQGITDLDLSYNKIPELNANDFESLDQVRRFNLQSNQLKKIPVDALKAMVSLEDLDLSKNMIYDLLMRGQGNFLRGLKRLNLSGNRIRSVMKNSFPQNNSIELLDLSTNIIEMIEEDAFLSCSNLKELNLGQNNITFIFALPPTLQIAILKINTLRRWPAFPSGITYIDLSYNRLSSLYDETDIKFDNLEVLNIGGNEINQISIVKKLPKLFSFDISYNSLTEVPKCISTQLFPNLEELHLDGNLIENIYFSNIIALKRLYMNDMGNLSVVEENAFSNVIGRSGEDRANCFSLSLSGCTSLVEIKDGAFAGTSLCMLDISRNQLTRLSKTLTDWNTITDGVNLQQNPWECSCQMQWVLDELLPAMYKSHSMLLAELRCGSPRAFEGLRLVHFYNWTEQAMCSNAMLKAGNYMLEPSTETLGSKVSYITLILVASIIVALIIAISLFVYLIKTRRRFRIRQAALKRKRQSAMDARNSNGSQKEPFSALNKT